AGEPADGGTLKCLATVEELPADGLDVVVDFTVPNAVRANLEWCARSGVHAVVGTTGLTAADLADLGELFAPERGVGCLVAPNFAIGAVLLTRFAELAAPWFETAEIVELHHDAKVDAPSGTSLLIAERMAAASPTWGADPTTRLRVEGARGAAGPSGLRIHSLRLAGAVAHHEVILGSTGQTLTLRHDSLDRASFVPGVLLAVKAVPGLPGLTVGIEALLGL
ncbi:MAG: 4-hydroxy-tetrahydrodipicolinate reductase, partial [Acidimicrobiales bacterium]